MIGLPAGTFICSVVDVGGEESAAVAGGSPWGPAFDRSTGDGEVGADMLQNESVSSRPDAVTRRRMPYLELYEPELWTFLSSGSLSLDGLSDMSASISVSGSVTWLPGVMLPSLGLEVRVRGVAPSSRSPTSGLLRYRDSSS